MEEKYEEGYKAGLNHAKQIIKDFADEKNPYWIFGDKKIPVATDVSALMRTLSYNLYIHIESILETF